MTVAEKIGEFLTPERTATAREAVAMAKVVFGGGGFARIADILHRHEWGELVDLGIADIAKCIAMTDSSLAPLAPVAAQVILWARHHPESVDSAAMAKVTGDNGRPGQNVSVGA